MEWKMRRLFLLVLLFVSQISAQNEFSLRGIYCDSFLYFLTPNSDIALLVKKFYCNRNGDSCYSEYFVYLYSIKGENKLRKIQLSKTDNFIYAFNVAHNGDSFIILSTRAKKRDISTIKKNILRENYGEFSYVPDEKNYILKKYSLYENRWLWEKEWYGESPPIRLTYSADDKLISCVSTKNTIIVDAHTGSLIRKSNVISSIGANPKYLKFDLSKNGRYFAFWWGMYLTWSIEDEAGGERLLDLAWYGLKWLFHLGMMKNYFYVWDIQNEKIFDKVAIPYQTVRGSPAFTDDEKEILMDVDCQCKVYSIVNKTIKDSPIELPCQNLNIVWQEWNGGYKIISPNGSFLAVYSDSGKILIFDYNNSHLLAKFKSTDEETTVAGDQYAMAFSPDSKYFAVVTSSYTDTVKTSQYTYTVEKGNKLNLFETQSWRKIWEKDLSKEE
jgi:hypothetical protein